MTQRAFNVRVDTDALPSLADRLGSLAATGLGLGAREAVNEVTTRFHEKALGGMTADIGLQPAYVRSKTDLALAVDLVRPRAVITTKGDLTILGRFPLQQLTQPAPKAKGDPSRGIPAGAKQAGVRVGIRRSAPASVPKWFTMRLRAGSAPGQNVGVFVRKSGRDKPYHMYGPSPYSLFRHQVVTRHDELQDDLSQTVARTLGGIIERTL